MAARRKGRRSWFDIFPVEEHIGQESPGENTDVVLLVDVGGNLGHDLIKFGEKYPHIPGRLILQDLPQVVTDLHLSQERIEPMAYDFCNPQPVKGRLLSACSLQNTDLTNLCRCQILSFPQHLPRLARSHVPHDPRKHHFGHGKKPL